MKQTFQLNDAEVKEAVIAYVEAKHGKGTTLKVDLETEEVCSGYGTQESYGHRVKITASREV